MIKKIYAFTLAEIVMVMGIIGIVATLTVTNAHKETNVATKVAQLRRCEEILSAATNQAVGENGSRLNWGTNGNVATAAQEWSILTQYLKLQKNCGTSSGCWHVGEPGNLFKSIRSRPKNYDSASDEYKGILSNGASVSFDGVRFAVDVDGKDKGSYVYGDDVFAFVWREDEILPYIGTIVLNEEIISESGCTGSSGFYCTAWVLKFGNQDYMKKCYKELSWNGKHTCRD